MTAALAETISEAHVFAEKAGLETSVLDSLIEQNYGTYAHSISRKLIEGVYLPPKGEKARSDLNLAIKDVGHGIASAKDVGARLEVAELTMEHLERSREWSTREGRALDSSAVYGTLRENSGISFETEHVKDRDRRQQ